MDSFFFHALVKLLRNKELLQDEWMFVEKQNVMFLCFFDKIASNYTVQKWFQRSSDIVNRYIHIVIDVIIQLSAKIIMSPRFVHPNLSNPKQYLTLSFKVSLILIIVKWILFLLNLRNLNYSQFYLHDCIGTIDSTYVPITIVYKDHAQYCNRKHILSHNIMPVCDFNYKFTYAMTKWEWSTQVQLY